LPISEPDRVLDQYLVALAQGGSRDAFERLVRHWTPRLLRYTSRTIGQAEAARDIVQETWIGAIRGIHGLTDAASFPAWIYGIAHRKCIDVIRANRRRRNVADAARREADLMQPVAHLPPEHSDEFDLAAALGQLNVEHREVVNLFYGEDLSVMEIAKVLSLPSGTVKSRLFHARDALRKSLGD
jgi:RNA polymerase sigma-70 factor (ECF subfamily)